MLKIIICSITKKKKKLLLIQLIFRHFGYSLFFFGEYTLDILTLLGNILKYVHTCI